MRNRDYEERTKRVAQIWRAALGVLAIAVAILPPHMTAQIQTTTVQGTVYRADGTPAAGTLLLSWPAFTTPQNQAVAAGNTSAPIGSDGFVSVKLTPNAAALPTGTYYTAVYHLNDGSVNQEYWVVPAAGNTSIASVRAQLQPSTIAVQPISKSYVDSAIASLNGSWLPIVGGTLTGPLNLNGDPSAANQAATKHYADQLAAAQLPLSGGTVTGPLNARQIEGRLYADQWQSGASSNDGIAMSLAECANFPYACQVLAPATYSTLEAPPWGGYNQWIYSRQMFAGPPASVANGTCLTDERLGAPQVMCVPTIPPYWGVGGSYEVGPSFTVMQTNNPPGFTTWSAAGLAVNKGIFFGTHNFSAGIPNGTGQTSNPGLQIVTTTFSPASTNSVANYLWANSNGDHIGLFDWDVSRGGISAGDNEGNEDRLAHMEAQDVWQGTVNSVTQVAGNDSSHTTSLCTAPCTVINATLTQGWKGDLGDELPVVDLTKAYSTGYITGLSGTTATAGGGANWDAQYGVSNAHTTTTQAITNPNGAQSNTFPATNYVVHVSSASGFVAGQVACVFDSSGTNWQCSNVTAVDTVNNTVTLAVVQQPQYNGSTIAQGGMTGMGFRMNIDCVGPNNMQGMTAVDGGPVNNLCTTWPIMYNSSGNNATILSGSRIGFKTRGYGQMGSGGTVTVTLSGGQATSCAASGGSGYGGWPGLGYLLNPPLLTYSVNAGGTPPTLELTTLSGTALSGCTVINPGANLTSVAVTVSTNNPYTVFPMARAVNVWNPTTGAVDGSSIALEAGGALAQFQAGDTIEQEHHYAMVFNGIAEHNFMYTAGGGISSTWNSYVGGNFGTSDSGAVIWNTNQPTLYTNYPAGATPWIPGQGTMGTPYGYTLNGSWRNGFWMKMPPYSTSSFTGALVVGCFDVVNNAYICSKWTQPYNMLLAQNANSGNTGEDVLQYSIPATTWTLTAGATGFGGANAYCTETLAGNASGGFSVRCNGKTSKLDTAGNLSLPGAVQAQGGVTGATINGEFTVDGATYTTLNAAWAAALSQATTSGQNQTVRLGPGTFAVTATLAEPTNGACVSLIGSAAPTVTADNGNASTVISVPSSLGGDLFSLQNTAGSQAQSCTFRNLLILANKNANHGFSLQWFRGLYVDDVTVNDTTQDAFYFGESSGTHQANFEMRNVTVSYSSASFTPASRPNYGLNLQGTVLDSLVENLLVRNAKQAAVYNAGGGTTFELIHGFGYPYTCTSAPCNNGETNSSAADASWATNYEVVDTGSGGNMYFNTYMDSPAVAAFDLKSNGVQINGGHIQWPETTSFPNATFAEVEGTVSSNLVISNVDCLNMSNSAGIPGSPAGNTGVWISYMGNNGSAPSYSSVSNLAGCGQYVQQRVSARQTAYDTAGNNSSNTNYGSGQTGVTPKIFVTPLSGQANQGGVEVENFSGGQGDSFYSGFSGQASNFAVMADGTIRHTGLQTSVVSATSSMTLTKANHIVLANASSGGFTLTLPSCYTPMPDGLTPTGMEFTIVKTDTTGNAVQLATTSGQTITVVGTKSGSYSLASAGGVTLACGPDSNYYGTEQIAASSTNAATANSLAATPTQCPAGSYATGIAANGNANCAQAWRSTWYGYFGGTFGTSTNSSLGAIWSPSVAVNMTRLDIAVGTAPAGCSTYPVIGIYDSTAAAWLKTVTLAAATYSYRNAVTGVSVTAGHNLSMGVQTAGVGCTTNPGSAQLTMEYAINQ